MKMTFRWYGEGDSIPLSHIRQIPSVTGVVTAVYSVPPGEAWAEEDILRLKKAAAAEKLSMEVIESVPVHEDIKLGKASRERFIENYRVTLKRLARAGVKCVCYNFMPVFDWLRTDLKTAAADGSYSLSYDESEILALNPEKLSLPGWDESYTPGQLNGLLKEYSALGREGLFENYMYFLNKILPVCESEGINMAVHPDDPPWDVFGLPRIVCCEGDLDRIFKKAPSPRNGLTFCTGSLGAGECDLPHLAAKYAAENRIFFAHLRNIEKRGYRSFSECAHPSGSGSLDMFAIVRALVTGGFDGYVRPDHGRNVWDEDGKPGYGLYDRAMGACYLSGLFEGIERSIKEKKL